MSRELDFDEWWEGNVEYSCDCCGKTVKFRFDSEDEAKNTQGQRDALRRKRGWIFTKVNGIWLDLCSDKCMVSYIKNRM